ncbi:hypothetical protein H4CHR_01028 [Variovorax sp. PBS-H4]|nr:hypothetical protein H4CHR_01028 [Variovorax sp. PBS-H4]
MQTAAKTTITDAVPGGCSAFDGHVLCLFSKWLAAYDYCIHQAKRPAMTSTDFSSATTALLPGQSLRVALDAGTALLVLEGRVRVVSPPSWFGETAFTVKNEFGEGEAYVAERGGWVEVDALASAAARICSLPRPVSETALGPSPVTRLLRLLLA